MKKMTRILVVLLTVAMASTFVLALAACNPTNTTTDNYIYVGQASTTYHDTEISIEVKVTVSNDKLTKVEIVNADDAGTTQGFTDTFKKGAQAFADEYLVGKTVAEIKALKVNYDESANEIEGVVTGATISSNLLVEAIQNALNGKLPVQNGGSNTDTTEDLFRAQCEAAGVTVPEYVDPNAPIYEAEGTVAEGEADVVTGASGVGSDYYPGAGSYQTLEYMYNRFSIKYYYSVTWKESATAIEGTTASTLEEAAALPNAKYIRQEFPNDGKNYSISMSGNALSSKTLITQDAEGNMTAAIYGLGIKKDDNGNYFVTGSITNKKTVANLLATDKALLVVYEYNPTDPDKMGAGNRNFGCRLVLTLDRQQTIFGQVVDGKYVMGDPVGDANEIPENSDFISVSLKVEEMWTIG